MSSSTKLKAIVLIILAGSARSRAMTHPTRVAENANCLECHAEKATGKHIHSPTREGCGSCHMIENQSGKSYVELRQQSPTLCLLCHNDDVFSKDPHFSYSPGACLGCHDPHGSSKPYLMRASVNDLCLSCHLRTKESASSSYLPTIVLTSGDSLGHPFANHPVKGKTDPLTGNEISCVSCHLAHGGDRRFHLKVGAEIPEDALNQNVETKDMCNRCHQAIWGLDGGVGKKNTRKK